MSKHYAMCYFDDASGNYIPMEVRPDSDLSAENALLRAEVERLSAISVTNIMIDIVPGWDGNGEEVFAKSVDDVESLLSKLSEKAEDFDLVTEPLRQELAASQLEAKRLREALGISDNLLRELPSLGGFYGLSVLENNEQALSSATSTDALDAYVAEKVKETPLIEGGKFKTWREIALHVGAWKDHELDYIHFGSEMAVRAFVIHLLRHRDDYEAELIRQRDLAVSAIENLVKQKGRHNTEIAYKKLVDVLAAIKESEA